jgi:hypothetical protein
MATQGIVEDGAPTKHVVHVSWFGRDPGGATIFIMPPAEEGAAAHPTAERDGGVVLAPS